MNCIMKFFKNYKTKKQLKAENKRLQSMLSCFNSKDFITQQKKLKQVIYSVCLNEFERNYPEDVFKKEILQKMMEQIENFIKWEIEDTYYGKIIKGSVYLMEDDNVQNKE